MVRWLLVIGALALSAPLAAQSTIPLDRGDSFSHMRTGITLPARIGDLRLDRMTDFGESQFDISGNYVSGDREVMATVYIYRAGFPDISVNFDVVMEAISGREGFSPAQKARIVPQAFAPRGHAVADALRMTWDVVSGGEFTTGGVALVPHGEWIIKLRVSSNRHNPAELLAFFDDLSGALDFGAPQYPAPAATMVKACTTDLATSDASVVDAAFEDVVPYTLFLDMVQTAQTEDGSTELLEPPAYCRDTDYSGQMVYRPNGRTDAYVILLNDAGNVVSVGGRTNLLSDMRAENSPHVAGIFSSPDVSALLGLFDGLARPDMVLDLLGGRDPLVVSNRDGNVTLYVDP
jgi:hypothetical protein